MRLVSLFLRSRYSCCHFFITFFFFFLCLPPPPQTPPQGRTFPFSVLVRAMSSFPHPTALNEPIPPFILASFYIFSPFFCLSVLFPKPRFYVIRNFSRVFLSRFLDLTFFPTFRGAFSKILSFFFLFMRPFFLFPPPPLLFDRL